MKKFLMMFLVLGLVLGGVLPAFAFTDDFNRAASSDLGSNWTIQYGSIGISDNKAASTSGNYNYATVNGFSGSYTTTRVSVDVYDINADLAYVALMFGVANSSESIFVKVQDQGGNGMFNRAAFYYGNNGIGNFFTLNTPFQSGRITAYATDANTIRLDIDSNFDSIVEQFYTDTGWSLKTLGSGIGLGMYGNARADNYSTEGGSQTVPEPATMLLLGLGLIGVAGVRRKFKK